MSDLKELSEKEKKELFWASFLALAAAGVGFVFRVMMPDIWGEEFQITGAQVGAIFGASLWPIAVTMIIFSIWIDKIGYKVSMFIALGLQATSVALTFICKDASTLMIASIFGGLGHGIIEAVINPLCASIYRDQKSKMLNILHAAWPAGIVAGGVFYLLSYESMAWRTTFLFMLIPIIAYGILFSLCHHYPVDERVEANVSNRDMLQEFGGLGAFLAITFLFYELSNQFMGYTGIAGGAFKEYLLYISLAIGLVGGLAFGKSVGSKGKWLFFFLCLLMIPLATAELATDGWIQSLMRPVLAEEYNMHAGWAIVASAFIMMVLRFFAGVPLKFMSPPALLVFSSIFSIIGLYLLSGATGVMIFLAFAFYGVGQTFYWPTVLGFVSEQFPKGGAMTLNTVSAMGLLTVGIFGFPFLGAVKDSFDAKAVQANQPALYEQYSSTKKFLSVVPYTSILASDAIGDASLSEEQSATLTKEVDKSARKTIKVAVSLPLTMAICFGLMVLWFKARGGYKPVDLFAGHEDDALEADPGV